MCCINRLSFVSDTSALLYTEIAFYLANKPETFEPPNLVEKLVNFLGAHAVLTSDQDVL